MQVPTTCMFSCFPLKRLNRFDVPKSITSDFLFFDEHKHLGIILDATLSFSAHIKAAISKTRKSIGMLRFLSGYLPRHTLDKLYKLYVRPHLDYDDVIYHIPPKVCDFTGGTTLSNLMEKLESVQYSAALAVTGAWRGTSRENLYLDLGWESLSLRRWSRRLVLFYKVINNLTPDYTRDPLPPLQRVQYSLRERDTIRQIRARTKNINLVFILTACPSGTHLIPK